MSDTSQQQSRLKELIARGKEQGYLTYAEVNDHLPEDIADPDQVEDIIRMINDMGISVTEEAPDAETLLMTEGDSAEEADDEAVAALAAVESDAGRTTDPVRMYMREMGTVELLTRQGEIEIAKRIEEGLREVMAGLAAFPGSVEAILGAYDATLEEEGRLSDIFSGYIDPDEGNEIPTAAPSTVAETDSEDDDESEEDDDDEEKERGPDPEEAKRRFDLVRSTYITYLKATESQGRDSKAAAKAFNELTDAFSPIKLAPRYYDMLVDNVRDAIDRIRRQERTIMQICTQRAKMPRRQFIKEFPGNETNTEWLQNLINSDAAYAPALKRHEIELKRAQKN